MPKTLILKANNFQSKLETFAKSEKKSIGISVFGYKNEEKHPIYVSKKYCKERDFIAKNTLLLLKILQLLWMIILYIVEKNIFGDIVCKL